MPEAGVTAAFQGACELCDFSFGPGARIKPVGSGWVHVECWERNHG